MRLEYRLYSSWIQLIIETSSSRRQRHPKIEYWFIIEKHAKYSLFQMEKFQRIRCVVWSLNFISYRLNSSLECILSAINLYNFSLENILCGWRIERAAKQLKQWIKAYFLHSSNIPNFYHGRCCQAKHIKNMEIENACMQ